MAHPRALRCRVESLKKARLSFPPFGGDAHLQVLQFHKAMEVQPSPMECPLKDALRSSLGKVSQCHGVTH